MICWEEWRCNSNYFPTEVIPRYKSKSTNQEPITKAIAKIIILWANHSNIQDPEPLISKCQSMLEGLQWLGNHFSMPKSKRGQNCCLVIHVIFII